MSDKPKLTKADLRFLAIMDENDLGVMALDGWFSEKLVGAPIEAAKYVELGLIEGEGDLSERFRFYTITDAGRAALAEASQ